MKTVFPFASLLPIALELIGLLWRPEQASLCVYMWIAVVLSIPALICSSFLADWQMIATWSWKGKTSFIFFLYWGLATAFSFAYTLIYFQFSSPSPAFTISSDISLKSFQTEREAVVIRAGGTRRLAFATAVALIRDPGANTKFLFTSMDPFHVTPPYIATFLKSVASFSNKRALKESFSSLSPIARFQASEYMHQYFAIPRKSDKEIQELSLIPDLIALRDRYEISNRLKNLGFAAQADEKVSEIYLRGNEPSTRKLMQANAARAIHVLEIADELVVEERRKYENVGREAQIWESHFHFLYFSFIALVTIGFGDIVPNSIPARVAVIVEVSWGIYIISMLVTTVLQQRK